MWCPRAFHIVPPEKAAGEHLCILGHDRSVPDVHFRKQSMYQPPRTALSEHLIIGDVLEILSKKHSPSQPSYQIKAMWPQILSTKCGFWSSFATPSVSNQKTFQATQKVWESYFHSPWSLREKRLTLDSGDLKNPKRTTNAVFKLLGTEGRTGFLLLLHGPQVNGLMQ